MILLLLFVCLYSHENLMLVVDVKSVRRLKNSRIHPAATAGTRAPGTRCVSPSMPVAVPLEWRWVILLTRCCWCCCSCSCSLCAEPLRILLPPALPRRESRMVSSMRTCHCHSGGDCSRSVRAEGGEGRLHPCLPLQCGGCCCASGATPGTFPFIACDISPRRPREDHRGREGERLSCH